MTLSHRASQVQEALDRHGVSLQVVELPDSTRTAKEAAEAVGCTVGQIAKSLVFQRVASNQPVLVIASGDHQVDVALLEERLEEEVRIADADFVRHATGFSIGGVPPVGHETRLETYLDRALFEYELIWAAAGTPHAVFSLTPQQLYDVTQGEIIAVVRS